MLVCCFQRYVSHFICTTIFHFDLYFPCVHCTFLFAYQRHRPRLAHSSGTDWLIFALQQWWQMSNDWGQPEAHENFKRWYACPALRHSYFFRFQFAVSNWICFFYILPQQTVAPLLHMRFPFWQKGSAHYEHLGKSCGSAVGLWTALIHMLMSYSRLSMIFYINFAVNCAGRSDTIFWMLSKAENPSIAGLASLLSVELQKCYQALHVRSSFRNNKYLVPSILDRPMYN